MNKIIQFIGVALACFISTFAASITHTATVFPQLTNWSVTNSVPQFDPTLGTLTNVSVSVGANLRNRFRVESRSGLPRSATTTGIGTITANVNGLVASTVITNSHTQKLGAFDGVLDYAGASGFDVTLDGVGQAVTDATDFVPFIGTGNIPLTASAVATGSYSGPGDYRFIINTIASAIVTVTYEFSPPVCPECPSASACDDDDDDDDDVKPPKKDDDCDDDDDRHKKSRRGRR